MDEKELKEKKKKYKKARLFQDTATVDELALTLRQEMGDAAWAGFEETDVVKFLEEVKSLGEEVDRKARDRTNIMVPGALAPYLERAKMLGSGAQIYIQDIYARGTKERDEIRTREKRLARKAKHSVVNLPPPVQPVKQQTPDPQLPADWVSKSDRNSDGSSAASRLGAVMFRYCLVSLRPYSQSKMDRLRGLQLQARFTAKSPAEYEEAMSTAQAWLRRAIPVAQQAIARRKGDTPQQAEEMRRLGPVLQDYVAGQREREEDHRKSVKARANHKVSIPKLVLPPAPKTALPLLTDTLVADDSAVLVPSVHPNDIATLAPGTSWTVFLDESYQGDADGAFQTEGNGIMAGVICRDDNPLPPQPNLHCASDFLPEQLKAQDDVVAELLRHPNCGVLAVPSSAYDVAMGWDDVLAAWVDVVIRLLPFPQGEEKVAIRVCVEPRDPYRTKEDFRALKLVCENSLKNSFPERARRVSLSFESLPKPRPGEKSGNAYPDIIGFTCLRYEGDNTAHQRYVDSGWHGVCHLNVAADRLARILRCFHRREPLDPATWSSILSHGAVGLVRALSRQFGERARCAPAEWERYLGFLYEHLTSGSVNMALLRRQVAWLESFRPAELSKRARLRWLVAQIALANHEGKIAARAGSPLRVEFDALCEELFDEMAPLVCDATLNLAVAYTNCYEFEMALALIQSLLGKDRATVGLSCYGKLLSTAGQHFAFLGMPDESIAKFNEALDCFSRLSDERDRSVNLDITRAYLTTATMDGRPQDARRALALYLLGDENASEDALAREAAALATGVKAKFHHHILLRYIVAQPNDDHLREAYLDAYEKWCAPSVGHPWELIEFYRAILLPESAERTRRLDTAYRLAEVEGGETLMVIAAVIAGAALADGLAGEWPDRFTRMVEGVKDMAGFRENGRYQTLVDQPTAKLSPLELAAKVLPFNFR